MNPINITLNEIIRFALSGGVFLVSIFMMRPDFYLFNSFSNYGDSITFSSFYLLMAIVIGGFIYTLYRATLFPLFYYLLRLWMRKKNLLPSFDEEIIWIPNTRRWTLVSEDELKRDFVRWEIKKRKGGLHENLKSWAAMVHFLYCSAIAISLASYFCWLDRGGRFDFLVIDWWSGKKVVVAIGIVGIWLAAVINHWRYLIFDGIIMKHDYELTSDVITTELSPRKMSMSRLENLKIKTISDCGLYEIGQLDMIKDNTDRSISVNINRFSTSLDRHSTKCKDGIPGDVHILVLDPKARAGNHYHKRIQEYFINIGYKDLVLHLKDRKTKEIIQVIIPPITREEIIVIRPKCGVTHLVENPNDILCPLLIIIDNDCPDDTIIDKILTN